MVNSLPIVDLAEVAQELADSPEIWWPKVRRDCGDRWYVPLLQDDVFEAWLLGWPVGGGIELHDHGRSSGALIVVEGTLVETYIGSYAWVRPGARIRHRRLPQGALVPFGPDHIHDVVNGGGRPALSIHTYSPRLCSMTFYENRPGSGLAPVRTEVSRTGLVRA